MTDLERAAAGTLGGPGGTYAAISDMEAENRRAMERERANSVIRTARAKQQMLAQEAETAEREAKAAKIAANAANKNALAMERAAKAEEKSSAAQAALARATAQADALSAAASAEEWNRKLTAVRPFVVVGLIAAAIGGAYMLVWRR